MVPEFTVPELPLPTQVPLIEKQPEARLKPFTAVEVPAPWITMVEVARRLPTVEVPMIVEEPCEMKPCLKVARSPARKVEEA